MVQGGLGRVGAVVLAGGNLEASLAEIVSVKHKAWLPLGGRLLVERVLDALDGCGRITRRVLVAVDEDVPEAVRQRVAGVAAPGATLLDSLESGVSRLQSEVDAVLAIPCDMPFLEPASLDDYLDRCERHLGDVWYSFVRREVSEARYPGLRHTWVRMADGTFCGGGLVMFRPPMIPRARTLLKQLAEARKYPWKLASLLGPKIIFKLLLRRLSVAEAEERMSLLLRGRAVAVESPCADVGFNVDAPEELDTARQLVGETA